MSRFLLLLSLLCLAVAGGCGKSEPSVVQPTAEMDAAQQAEEAEAEEAIETSDE